MMLVSTVYSFYVSGLLEVIGKIWGGGDKDTWCCEWLECLSYAGHAFDHYPSDINIWKRKRSLKDTVGELSGYHNHPVWHSSHKNIGTV